MTSDASDRFTRHELNGACHPLDFASLGVERLKVDFAQRGDKEVRGAVLFDGDVAPTSFRVICRDAHRRGLVERAVVEFFGFSNLLHYADRLDRTALYSRLEPLIDVGENDLSDGIAV